MIAMTQNIANTIMEECSVDKLFTTVDGLSFKSIKEACLHVNNLACKKIESWYYQPTQAPSFEELIEVDEFELVAFTW